MKLRVSALAGALALAASAAQASSFVNGSFELTDPGGIDGYAGWTVSHPGLTATIDLTFHSDPGGAADHLDMPYAVQAGDVFATLTAGPADTVVGISQVFDTAGGHFTGFAAFLGEDYLDPSGAHYPTPGAFDDYAFVRISGPGAPGGFAFFSRIFQVGDFGLTPWTRFDVELAPGRYTIEAGVVNGGDGLNGSRLLLDAFAVPGAAVPEPATWALMLSGFFGLGAALRTRRRSAA